LLAIVNISLIIPLDRRRDSTTLLVAAVLVDRAGVEFSVVVGAFKIAAILVNSRGVEFLGIVFTSSVNIASRAT